MAGSQALRPVAGQSDGLAQLPLGDRPVGVGEVDPGQRVVDPDEGGLDPGQGLGGGRPEVAHATARHGVVQG